MGRAQWRHGWAYPGGVRALPPSAPASPLPCFWGCPGHCPSCQGQGPGEVLENSGGGEGRPYGAASTSTPRKTIPASFRPLPEGR